MNAPKERPARLFRTAVDAQYFEMRKQDLIETEVGARLCGILCGCADDDRVRLMNTFIAKHGFIYILAKISRQDTLTDLEQRYVDEFLMNFEESQIGHSTTIPESAVPC